MNTTTKVIIGIIVIAVIALVGWKLISSSQQPSEAQNVLQNQPLPTTTIAETPVREFTVIGTPFKFDPVEIKIKQGDRVRITFKNEEGFHNFSIKDLNMATKNLQKGESEIVEFTADKVGTFQYNCSVPTHTEKGMVGQLVVE